jgi:hypothetical protein
MSGFCTLAYTTGFRPWEQAGRPAEEEFSGLLDRELSQRPAPLHATPTSPSYGATSQRCGAMTSAAPRTSSSTSAAFTTCPAWHGEAFDAG